jgi:hypothetical protein
MATHGHIGTIERANDAKPKDENESDDERSSSCQAEYLGGLYDEVRSPDQ